MNHFSILDVNSKENHSKINLEGIINLSNEELDIYTDNIYNKLVELDLPVIKGAKSRTEYGSSNYLYVNDIKIRVSDHPVTSNARLMSEIHFYLNNRRYDEKRIENIELAVAPERFEKTETPVITTVYLDVCQQQLKYSDNIISERTSKNGNKIYKIERVYNNKTIVFIKKTFPHEHR